MGFRFIEPVRSLEDIKIGEKIRTNGRTICQCDLINFCGIIGDPHALHLSKIEAGESPAGRIVVSGPLVMSIAIGLMAQTHWLTPVLGIFMGINNMRALKPVYPEDTVYAIVSPAELKEAKSGKGSILTLAFEVYDRRDDAKEDDEDVKVMTFEVIFLVK